MIFKTLRGASKDIKIRHYLIDWGGDSLSHFQEEVKAFLYPYWRRDVVCEELPVAGTKMRFDMINISRKVIVEVNGVAHLDPDSHFHQGSRARWLSQIKRDHAKTEWAEMNGYQMAEIEPDDLPLTKDFFKRQFDIDL